MTYVVAIKDSAIESNPAANALAQEEGEIIECDSKSDADQLAVELSENGERLRIQRVAPQDKSGVDGYLVRHPEQFQYEPKSVERDWMTFDTDANLYGELGKSLIIGTYGVGPSLRYYLFEEFPELSKGLHRLTRRHEPYLPDDAPTVSWSPDGLIKAYNKVTGDLDRLVFFEVKSGDASFERGQLGDMQAVAEVYDVLKIRVNIDGLPGEYSVKIDRL